MASSVEVDMAALVSHFSHDFKKSLKDAVNRTAPDSEIDLSRLFREFEHAVRRNFRNSETLPSSVMR